MDVYEGIMAGLKEALEYERGKRQLITHAIGHCPNCGHHINFSDLGVGYCPVCDEYFTPEDCR